MNNSDIIAVCSVVISLSALIFSIVESRRNVKVARLSVRPKAQSRFVRNRSSFDDVTPGIYLENRGLGPAILNVCRLTVGESSYDVANHRELDEYISKLGIASVEHGRIVIRPGAYLPPGSSYDIISFASSGSSEVKNRFWTETEVHCSYSSIFGEDIQPGTKLQTKT